MVDALVALCHFQCPFASQFVVLGLCLAVRLAVVYCRHVVFANGQRLVAFLDKRSRIAPHKCECDDENGEYIK